MIRSLSLAAILATTLSLPVLAQSTDLPRTAPAATTTAPDQNTTGAGSASGAAMPGSSEEAITLTSQQAEDWVGKTVYSSDGKNVGEVAAFARGSDDKVSEMHIDIGGFLGLGETRVKLMPNQFKLSGDRATIDMTSDQVKDLPKVE